jgi:hypothetical protein
VTDTPVLMDESAHEATPVTDPARPGTLVAAWRVALVVTWALVVFAYASVWNVSVQLGLGTWWLGPRPNPQPLVVQMIPFLLAITFGVLSTTNIRRLPIINMLGAVLLGAIAIPDFSRSVGIATIELVIAFAVLLVAVGSFSGVVKTVDR